MSYSKGFGGSVGEGMAAFVQQFIGRQDQVKQQGQQEAQLAQQEAQRAIDNGFRDRQAAEQQRQFEAQSKQARDTQAFQFLQGQQSQMTAILAKGGYAKDSPEYQAAQQALRSTNQLMSRTIRGDVPSPEDMAAHDTLIGNVGAIIAGGAATLGDRATTQDNAALAATQAGTTSTVDANSRANELQPFGVVNAGLQNRVAGAQANVAEATQGYSIQNAGNQARVGAVAADVAEGTQPYQITAAQNQARLGTSAANVAEGTEGAQITTAENTAAQSGVNLQLSEAELAKVQATAATTIDAMNSSNDLTVSRNAVLKGMLGLDSAAQRATYLGQIAAQGEIGTGVVQSLLADGLIDEATAQGALTKANRVATGENLQLDILGDQAAITDNERFKSDQTLSSSIDLFNSDADLKLKTNRAESDLLTLRTAGQRAAYLQGIAKMGAPGQAILDGLKDKGLITDQQASAFKKVAGNAQTVDTATAQGATVQVAAAQFDLSRAKQLFPLELKNAQAALDMAGQQLAAFKENRPVNLATLKANLATINQALDQNGQLFGPRLDAARLQVKQLESELRVAQGTEQPRIDAATAGARTAGAQADVAQGTVGSTINAAQSQATSAGAQAQVDVATIPAQIAARNVSVQQAQAALAAQLTENRFADATFSRRVAAIDLNNSTSTQQLLALKQQYSQNAAKFPTELAYLKAQLSVQQENAKTLAAERVGTDGSVSGDRKTVLSSLDAMRKINADERRLAANNLVNVARRLMPNAKFSIDKYDPKSFTTLVGSTSTLTDEQKQELNNAQLAFDTAASKASDLSMAFAQISGKGKMDPKVAERLGFSEAVAAPLSPPKVAPGLSAAQEWAAQNVEIPGVDSDCAAVAGKYLNELGLKIPTSNLSAGLEANAKKAGWTSIPVKNGLKEGDLVVWTGAKYGMQKDANKIGKHVGVVVMDANGNPQILQNPGKLADGTQGKTEIKPMFDVGNAVIYRSPQAGSLAATATPTATASPAQPAAPTPLPPGWSPKEIAAALAANTPAGSTRPDPKTYMGGSAAIVKGAPVAPGVPPGVVTGKGGVVFAGAATLPASNLPRTVISRQVADTIKTYINKVAQQKGNSDPWDNAAGPVRAYNGLKPSLPQQIAYVNDTRAVYNAQPWVKAIETATGPRKAELLFINNEAERLARVGKVDANVIKALMWNESMGWQPAKPSGDGKGGGLGQITGYKVPSKTTAPVPGWSPAELAAKAAATTSTVTKTTPIKPTDVQANLSSQAKKLTPFYTTIKAAPSAEAAQKLLMNQAIIMAGGPNAPRALKQQYFDALLAEAKK